jgi:hypothetical protein
METNPVAYGYIADLCLVMPNQTTSTLARITSGYRKIGRSYAPITITIKNGRNKYYKHRSINEEERHRWK